MCFFNGIQSLTGPDTDLNLGDGMNASSYWSAINIKNLQTDRSFVFCFMFSRDKYALL